MYAWCFILTPQTILQAFFLGICLFFVADMKAGAKNTNNRKRLVVQTEGSCCNAHCSGKEPHGPATGRRIPGWVQNESRWSVNHHQSSEKLEGWLTSFLISFLHFSFCAKLHMQTSSITACCVPAFE